MPSDNLEWVDITDFSPGLYEPLNRRDTTVKATNAPDGAADAAYTYGCRSAPDGGLVGLPKAIRVVQLDSSNEHTYRDGAQQASGYVYCPPPTDPAVADSRLMDFDLQQVEENYQRPMWNDISETWTWPYPSNPNTVLDQSLIQGNMVFAAWQMYGDDDSQDDVAFEVLVNRSSNLEYKGTQWKLWHVHDGATAGSVYEAANLATYWHKVTDTWYFEGQVMDPSQKRYGYVEIGSIRGLRESTSASFPGWKYGQQVFWGIYDNFSDLETDQISWQTEYIQNGINVPAVHGGGMVTCGSDNLTQENWPDNPNPTNYMVIRDMQQWSDSLLTTGVNHGGRLMFAAAPTILSGWSYETGASNKNLYKQNYAAAGRNIYDASGNLGSLNNMQLHYTKIRSNMYRETGTEDGNAPVALPFPKNTKVNALASLDAARLLALSTTAGACLMEGTVGTAQGTMLPSVEPTWGFTPHPVNINGGLVYGSKSGLWLWEGEDSSKLISPQLHGKFWMTDEFDTNDTYQPAAPRGRMAYRAPYLFAPNGWVYDTEQGGWWKLSDNESEKLTHWRIDEQGNAWGARATQDQSSPSSATSGGTVNDFDEDLDTAALDNWGFVEYDVDSERQEWAWKSQPLAISRTHSVEIREISMTIQTEADFLVAAVSISSGDTELWNSNFLNVAQFNSGYPEQVYLPCHAIGDNLQISMLFQGDAPVKVSRLSFAWKQEHHLRQHPNEA